VRRYPAITFTWLHRPDEAELERLTAHLDNGSLLAVDDLDGEWRAYFGSAAARDEALAMLAGSAHAPQARALDVADEGWAERSQAAIQPVTVGRLVITPPWHEAAVRRRAGPDTIVIVIRPSMGFGTGHHASTRRCLSLLQSTVLTGRSVLDVGTGSGVLAIAAWALGADPVAALDNDPDAVACARENAASNGATGISVLESDLSSDVAGGGESKSYDVLLANLTGATLIAIAARLAARARPGGQLIASGLDTSERPGVVAALGAAGWRESACEIEEGWVGLRLERTATSPTASRGN